MSLDFEAAALAGTDDNLLVELTGTGTTPTLALTGDGTGDIETVTFHSKFHKYSTTLTTADINTTTLKVTDQALTITDALSVKLQQLMLQKVLVV